MHATSKGFTIIELAIAVLLMGILAAVAAPRYLDALTAYRMQMAAVRIAADLQFAAHHAKQTSTNQTVQFSPADDEYVLAGIADFDHPQDVYRVNLASADFGADLHSADFGSSTSVTFDIHGRPDSSGTVVVQARKHRRTILLDRVGNASVN